MVARVDRGDGTEHTVGVALLVVGLERRAPHGAGGDDDLTRRVLGRGECGDVVSTPPRFSVKLLPTNRMESGSTAWSFASCAMAAPPRPPSSTKMTVPTRASRQVRMTVPHCPAGRVRQWLGAVPAARVWAACQSLPLCWYDATAVALGSRGGGREGGPPSPTPNAGQRRWARLSPLFRLEERPAPRTGPRKLGSGSNAADRAPDRRHLGGEDDADAPGATVEWTRADRPSSPPRPGAGRCHRPTGRG